MSELYSTMENPRLEFAMVIRLTFPRAQVIPNTPAGSFETRHAAALTLLELPLHGNRSHVHARIGRVPDLHRAHLCRNRLGHFVVTRGRHDRATAS